MSSASSNPPQAAQALAALNALFQTPKGSQLIGHLTQIVNGLKGVAHIMATHPIPGFDVADLLQPFNDFHPTSTSILQQQQHAQMQNLARQQQQLVQQQQMRSQQQQQQMHGSSPPLFQQPFQQQQQQQTLQQQLLQHQELQRQQQKNQMFAQYLSHLQQMPSNIPNVIPSRSPIQSISMTKRKRDPNAPKPPLSSYLLFCQHERARVKEDFPHLDQKEVATELGKRWKALLPEEKLPFEDQSRTLRDEYNLKVAEYKITLAGGDPLSGTGSPMTSAASMPSATLDANKLEDPTSPDIMDLIGFALSSDQHQHEQLNQHQLQQQQQQQLQLQLQQQQLFQSLEQEQQHVQLQPHQILPPSGLKRATETESQDDDPDKRLRLI